MSSKVTFFLPSRAAIVFAVLSITISARCVLTPSLMHVSAASFNKSSLTSTSLTIRFACTIFSLSSFCFPSNFFLNSSGSFSKLPTSFTISTLLSASSILSTLACSPNLSKSCGLSSPSSGFIVPTRMNLEG